MKVTSRKPKGQRLFKSCRFLHNCAGKTLYVKRPFWVEPVGYGWWFDLDAGEWYQGYDSSRRSTTSYYSMAMNGFNNVYSLKAVKRLIYKWDVPKGTKFVASLPFAGHDFYITK